MINSFNYFKFIHSCKVNTLNTYFIFFFVFHVIDKLINSPIIVIYSQYPLSLLNSISRNLILRSTNCLPTRRRIFYRKSSLRSMVSRSQSIVNTCTKGKVPRSRVIEVLLLQTGYPSSKRSATILIDN